MDNQTDNKSLAETSYQNPIIGWIYVIQGTLYLILFFPCFVVMIRKPLIENSCYKIMVSMAVCDLINIIVGSYVCGAFSIIGVSLEEKYMLCKVVGAIANAFWYSCIALNLALALNRLVDLRSKKW